MPGEPFDFMVKRILAKKQMADSGEFVHNHSVGEYLRNKMIAVFGYIERFIVQHFLKFFCINRMKAIPIKFTFSFKQAFE